MERLFFGSSDHLFGMYHPAINQPRNHGVVVCAPLFHEFYRSHLAIRRISIELAQKGYEVLRFDYSGTGDSKGGIPADMFNVWSDDKTRLAENDYLGTGQSRENVSKLLAAFATRADAQIQEVNSVKLVEIRSDLDWVSASLKTIYAHDTVSQISSAM